jgi:hypothetical protein
MKTPRLLVVLFLLCIGNTYAQIGIGTTLPHITSELEVSSTNKGILIPRIELTGDKDKTTIKGSDYPESLIVYHTGIPTLEAGFYFWSKNKWNALVSNSTLYKYIKEEASADTVTITHDNGDYIFTWKDKDSGVEMTMKLSDVIKKFETLTELKGAYEENEAVLVYTPERGDVNKVKLTELLKNSSVFNDYIKTLIPEVAKETITTLTPQYTDATNTKTTGIYTYINEAKASVIINVIADVNNNFENIITNTGVRQLLNTFITTEVETVVTYKQDKFFVTQPDGNGGTKVTEIDLAPIVKAYETLTTLTPEEITMYVYLVQNPLTGEMLEEHLDHEKVIDPNEPVVPSLIRKYKTKKFVYKNEKSELVDIKGSDLFGGIGTDGGKVGVETVTSLKLEDNYNSKGKALVYNDENKDNTAIYISDIFSDSETLTSLKGDSTTQELIYTDELKNITSIPFSQIAQEPWLVVKTHEQATNNKQDVYMSGWVGIGYDEKSDATKVPNEKLRVNGSITATNSYYADYVFESYFKGYSSLKYDYKFNDLSTVDHFIRTNKHLPGITPINELTKTDSGYSFNISELSIQLLEKTEELFLHVIDQQKELNAKENRIEKLESEMNDLTKRLHALEALLIK